MSDKKRSKRNIAKQNNKKYSQKYFIMLFNGYFYIFYSVKIR